MADDTEESKIKVRKDLGPAPPFDEGHIEHRGGYFSTMSETMRARKAAVESAIANNGLSGFTSSAFARGVFTVWIHGDLNTDAAVQRVVDHYKALATILAPASDGKAWSNKLGLSDSGMLKSFEADVTTLRMAELEINPV